MLYIRIWQQLQHPCMSTSLIVWRELLPGRGNDFDRFNSYFSYLIIHYIAKNFTKWRWFLVSILHYFVLEFYCEFNVQRQKVEWLCDRSLLPTGTFGDDSKNDKFGSGRGTRFQTALFLFESASGSAHHFGKWVLFKIIKGEFLS